MNTDEDGFPTIGKGPGKTVDAVGDETGSLQFEGEEAVLKDAGLIQDTKMEKPLGELGGQVSAEENQLQTQKELIREALPEKAELLDDGRLRAESSRDNGRFDYLNGRRRFILGKLDEGLNPMDIVREFGFPDSYVYRARDVFGFLLKSPILFENFVESGGRYAPAYDPTEEGETTSEPQETVEEEIEKEDVEEIDLTKTDFSDDVLERVYQVGKIEGKAEAVKELEQIEEETGTDEPLFTTDEWWDLMKTLMEHGEEGYARRIASEIDFTD